MFTFDATPVKFVGLLIFFLYTTGWGVYALTKPGDWKQRVSGALHLWMSIVMLLMVSTMVWRPFVKVIPVPVLIATQVISVVWFLYMAFSSADKGKRLHFLGHSAMFGAMAWHLSAMFVKMPHMVKGADGKMGMDMQWMKQASMPGGPLWVAALVGVPFMLYLLIAGVKYLVEVFQVAPATPHTEAAACHAPAVVGTRDHRLGKLHDALMNLGMFWMSTGLMTALLPFMKYLAF